MEKERPDPGGDRGRSNPTTVRTTGQDQASCNQECDGGQRIDRLAEKAGPDQLTVGGCAHRVNGMRVSGAGAGYGPAVEDLERKER